jgi:hypothetical protein
MSQAACRHEYANAPWVVDAGTLTGCVHYLYPYPTDLRKSFITLGGIVTNKLRRNLQIWGKSSERFIQKDTLLRILDFDGLEMLEEDKTLTKSTEEEI